MNEQVITFYAKQRQQLALALQNAHLSPSQVQLSNIFPHDNDDLSSPGGGEHCGRVPGRREGHHRDLLCEGRHHRHRLPAGEGEAQCSAHQGQVVLLVMQILVLIRNFLRFCLVVVGDMSTLEKASQDLWGELIKDARSRGRYLSFILCHCELSCQMRQFLNPRLLKVSSSSQLGEMLKAG